MKSAFSYWLGCGLLAALLSACYEITFYTGWLELSSRIFNPIFDVVLVFVFLLAKTLLLLVPVLLLSAVLLKVGFPRAAGFQFFLTTAILFSWIHLDLACQDVSGNHILFYLPMVLTLTTQAGAEMVGGTTTVLLNVLPVFLFLAGLAVILRIAKNKLKAAPLRLTSGLAIGIALAGLLAPMGLSERNLDWRLNDLLPVSFDLVFQALNQVKPDSRVMIVAAKPDPRGPGAEEVMLSNRTDGEVDLAGWFLYNRLGQRLALEGSLGPNETKSFFASNFTLDNLKDKLVLVSADGEKEDWTQYSQEFIQQDRVLNFRPRHERSPFLKLLTAEGESVFAELRRVLGVPQPADKTYKLPEGRRPNVVLLVIESLRQDALTAEKTPLLHAYGARGLTLNNHVTTNSSHLGLFTILYGRVPITYQRDLLAAVPPQLPILFKEAGYETQFYTGAPFQDWLGMGLFVNEEYFDLIREPESTGPSPDIGWAGWPEKDRQMLQDVGQYINGPSRKPLMAVCFLKSTHFPFAYPDEFARRKPDGHKAYSLANWTRLPEEQLRNRYANSVSFLESEIVNLLESIDLENTIVIVTGDHGESFWEDGTLSHGNRASVVQCTVPCLILGGGVKSGTVNSVTSHQDLLPTLLHLVSGESPSLSGCHGQDLLADGPLRESTFIAPNCLSEPSELVFIYNDYRLLFELYSDAGMAKPYTRLFASGFLDETGKLEGVTPRLEQVDDFLAHLKRAVDFLRD